MFGRRPAADIDRKLGVTQDVVASSGRLAHLGSSRAGQGVAKDYLFGVMRQGEAGEAGSGNACAANAQVQYEEGPRRVQGDSEKHCDRRVRRGEHIETQRN